MSQEKRYSQKNFMDAQDFMHGKVHEQAGALQFAILACIAEVIGQRDTLREYLDTETFRNHLENHIGLPWEECPERECLSFRALIASLADSPAPSPAEPKDERSQS